MVHLVPMSDTDYQRYIADAVKGYAREQIKAGVWHPEIAEELARQAFEALLPKGLSSPEQFLYVIETEEAVQVGYLWMGLRMEGERNVGALYDFVIFDEHRRQGYGSKALLAMEEKAHLQGAERVVLHVFGHNDAARALYRKMGYTERNVTMVKKLPAIQG